MEKKMKEALKDLIVRLEDAHKGYIEVKNAISNTVLRDWMDKYAMERKKFQSELEESLEKLGGDAEIKTSFLGELHRMFIAFKFNNISNDYESVFKEIERGSKVLIEDYEKVINEVQYPLYIETKLKSQLSFIKDEIKSLKKLKSEMLSEMVS